MKKKVLFSLLLIPTLLTSCQNVKSQLEKPELEFVENYVYGEIPNCYIYNKIKITNNNSVNVEFYSTDEWQFYEIVPAKSSIIVMFRWEEPTSMSSYQKHSGYFVSDGYKGSEESTIDVYLWKQPAYNDK